MTAEVRPGGAGMAGAPGATPDPVTGLSVRVRHGRNPVLDVLAAAADLFAETRTPVCARATWLSTWIEAFGDQEPVAVVVDRGDRLDALACLAVSRRGPLRTVRLAGAGPSDYGRLPARDAVAAAALADGIAGVLHGLRSPWRLHLDQLPVADPVVGALLAALPRAYTEDGQPCPQVVFGADREPAQLTASGRRTLRKARDRLDRTGLAMTVDRTRDPEQVRRLLPDLIALHRDRDHSVGRRSDLDDPGRRAFYAAVASRLADSGQVEIFVLRLDGRLAAFSLGLRDGSVFRGWDGRICSDWPELSLGVLLRAELVTALLAEPGITAIDQCRGVLQHKMHGVTAVVPTLALRAESSPGVTRALRAGTWLHHELRRQVRRRVPPDLFRRLRRLDRR